MHEKNQENKMLKIELSKIKKEMMHAVKEQNKMLN
jgi:hypothetical protein